MSDSGKIAKTSRGRRTQLRAIARAEAKVSKEDQKKQQDMARAIANLPRRK